MTIAYYDTTYLLKLQIAEAGTAEVRAHAATVIEIHSAHHGRAEFASAAFCKVREGVATPADYQRLIAQFNADIAATTYLRAADAVHLATAAEHGFTEIHSNDKHLLAAAPLFGLLGVNVIL